MVETPCRTAVVLWDQVKKGDALVLKRRGKIMEEDTGKAKRIATALKISSCSPFFFLPTTLCVL